MKVFSLVLLTLFSQVGFAVLDDVKPEDNDQALRVRVIAPPERNLPSHATRLPRVTVYASDECRDRLFGLQTHKLQPFGVTESQKPLKAGKAYCIHYFMPSEDDDSQGRSFTVMRGKMDTALVVRTVKMRRIDVHNVIVTRPDGSKYTVKGNFKLEVLGIDKDREDRELGYFETGLGIDVPGGFVYRVSVSAETEDGPMEYAKELDFRKE